MKVLFISILALLTTIQVYAQDPLRFKADMEKFKAMPVPEGEVTVITGSSSVRFWTDVNMDCDDSTIINTGFGGSQMSDLLYWIDEAVLRFKPSKVFIYEGDNDINDGKRSSEILDDLMVVVQKIFEHNPEAEIYVIGAKPSPSRWEHETRYLELNSILKMWCLRQKQISFIDVWRPMLTEANRPKPEIFIADSLHMNRKGYDIWRDAICKYMN